ncbi:MAG: monofunctional biosynthetic peptidoglycan transglycosylase [Flavobacteriales bacterium]|jgi:monofunctional biosynthetic peptidoglycan transglycosylase|nr:monofunctional biosynthetic peptidoglycan transglycosylase [Flavobacteriales bacterium]
MHLIRSILRWTGAALCWGAVATVLWVLLLRWVDPPITWHMAQQAREQGRLERAWAPLPEISRHLPLAVIASEDQRFFHHGGFSWEAIERAREHNRQGRRVRGASTISQQTAKNVFLWPQRSWLRKGLEVGFTVLVEALWSKERILEVYLNVAEMGPGVFGAQAAARHCFGRTADRLTAAQCALIAATLPAPRRYACKRPSAYLSGRQRWVQRQMRNIGDQMDPEVRRRVGEKVRAEKRK